MDHEYLNEDNSYDDMPDLIDDEGNVNYYNSRKYEYEVEVEDPTIRYHRFDSIDAFGLMRMAKRVYGTEISFHQARQYLRKIDNGRIFILTDRNPFTDEQM